MKEQVQAETTPVPKIDSFAPEMKEGEVIELVPISSIVIKERQRKDMGKEFEKHISRLAESIQRAGLLHPITLEDDSNELVAGFCRIMAFLKLERDIIPARRRSQMNDLQKKILELEENLGRLNLTWWEKAAAIADIDSTQRVLYPEEWNQRKTAEMVGESVGTVNQSIQLAEELKSNPEFVKEHKTLVGALNAIKTKKQIEKRKEDIQLKAAGRIKTFPAQIILGDALDLIREQPDEEFDAVITNFPFGIDLELKGGKKVYHDEEQYIVDLVQGVVKESFRVLKDDSWFVGFFDDRKITYSNHQLALYNYLMSQQGFVEDESLVKLAFDSMGLTFWLEKAGFKHVTLMPCVWVKPNKTQGIIGDPKKGMIVAYESFVFASKGDAALLKQGRQNIFIFNTPASGERIHELQMSEELCTEIVKMVALGGSKILDPFAGSGAIGQGALNCGCEFLGFELDEEKASRGQMLLGEHFLAKEKSDAQAS